LNTLGIVIFYEKPTYANEAGFLSVLFILWIMFAFGNKIFEFLDPLQIVWIFQRWRINNTSATYLLIQGEINLYFL